MPGSNDYSLLSTQGGSNVQPDKVIDLNPVNVTASSSSSGSGGGGFGLGDILSWISSPISSIVNYFSNKSLNEQRNRMAIEQWNRENEYNLPKNQVQRLKDAGLNPALMYENGASGLVSAQSPELTSSFADFRGLDPLSLSQIALNSSQARELDSRIPERKKVIEKMDADIESLKHYNDMLDSQSDLFKQDSNKVASDVLFNVYSLKDRLVGVSYDALNKEESWKRARIENKYVGNLMQATTAQLSALAANLNKDTEFYKKRGEEIDAKIGELEAYSNEVNARLPYVGAHETQSIISGYVDNVMDIMSFIATRGQSGLVREVVTTTSGGGKPSSKTTQVSRNRKAK